MNDGGFSKYKPIRNDIRKFDAEKLLLLTLKHLHKVSKTPAREWSSTGMTPWELLLLVKWTLHESSESKSKKPMYRDFARIVNKIKDMSDDLGVPKDSSHKLEKFFRKMAFQQFWLQQGQTLSRAKLGRTIELFLNMECRYDLDMLLTEKLGLNRKDVLDLSFITWVKLNSDLEKEPFLTGGFFSTINNINQEKLTKFFNLISVDYDDAISLAKEATSKRSFSLQRFEQTPFKNKPFLRTDKGLLSFCPIVFSDYLENFFYDFAKTESGGAFNHHFGKVFESYVDAGLQEITTSYIREGEIKRRFGCNKTVDFFIENDNGNILIECKAIELSPLARVNPVDNVLESSLKDSIVKSIAQSIEVISSIDVSKNKPTSDINYVLVVTFKELYLGNGEVAWEEFIKDAVEKYYPEHDTSVIDPEKLFFVSVNDFDKVCSIYQERLNDFLLKLKDIAAAKQSPEDMKYVFGMYLGEDGEGKERELLRNTFDTYFNLWKERLTSS